MKGPAEKVKQESLDASDITIQTKIGNAKVESNDNSPGGLEEDELSSLPDPHSPLTISKGHRIQTATLLSESDSDDDISGSLKRPIYASSSDKSPSTTRFKKTSKACASPPEKATAPLRNR